MSQKKTRPFVGIAKQSYSDDPPSNSVGEGKENRSENLFIILLGVELLRPANKGIGDFEATGPQPHARHDISYEMLPIHRIYNPLGFSELTICD